MKQQTSPGALPECLEQETLSEVSALLEKRFLAAPRAFVRTYGCQQNEADSQRLWGVLRLLGCVEAADPLSADLILFNTCAVRDAAERRVLGNVGALKGLKEARREVLIIVCGCMPQQESAREKLRESYPYVDIVFGASAPHRLPALIRRRLVEGRRVIDGTDPTPPPESTPISRPGGPMAWLPIMQGCDNFCSYCVVPYVRGRECSRDPHEILREAESLIAAGYKEITLLGQNVNSYGKGIPGASFPALLEQLDKLPGVFRLRFMTSHPKDCTDQLLDTVAASKKVVHHIHLPVQSGSSSVLERMNRRYSREDYLALIRRARERIPDVTFSSDIIVGFPGESEEEFLETLSLVREVQFLCLFTFLYSKRGGTPAATMEGQISPGDKKRRFGELLAVQGEIGRALYEGYVGQTLRVLCQGPGKKSGTFVGRSDQNVIVEFTGTAVVGEFCSVTVRSAKNAALAGIIEP